MLASSGLPANRSRSHQDMLMSYSYLTHVKKLEMQPGMRHKVRKSESQKVRKSESQKVRKSVRTKLILTVALITTDSGSSRNVP